MQVHSSPALGADGTIYVGSGDEHLHAVAEGNGAQKWKYETGHYVAESRPGTRHKSSLAGHASAVTSEWAMTQAVEYTLTRDDWETNSSRDGVSELV